MFKRISTTAGLAGLIVCLQAGTATAQQGDIELGIDLNLFTYTSVSSLDTLEFENVTSVSVPMPRFRVGYFLGDAFELEGSLLLDYVKVSGDDSEMDFIGTLAGLYHFGSDPYATRFFVGALGLFESYDPGAAASVSRFGLGGMVGAKLPISGNAAVRLEVDYVYRFEKSDDFLPATSDISLLAGFSFFL
jgi:hypothetical protein